MRLEVTRRTDLATRALLALAQSGERRKASELADLLDTSPGFLSHAMTPLVAQGWVRSDPGRSGGYTAVVALEDLSVLDVIEAIEGKTDVTHCVLEERSCATGGRCALHDAWSQARAHLLRDLAKTPLSAMAPATDLAESQDQPRSIPPDKPVPAPRQANPAPTHGRVEH